MPALWLAFDATSPRMSAALAEQGALLAEVMAPSRGGRTLLQLVADSFAAAGRAPADVAAIVAVRGPGSFTGVRITLATALGLAPDGPGDTPELHTISSLAALALQPSSGGAPIVAIVDALRGEWFHQRFARQGDGIVALGEPARLAAPEIDLAPPALAVAFAETGVAALHPGAAVAEAQPLAAAVARRASAGEAGAVLSRGVEPLYLRNASVTVKGAAAAT